MRTYQFVHEKIKNNLNTTIIDNIIPLYSNYCAKYRYICCTKELLSLMKKNQNCLLYLCDCEYIDKHFLAEYNGESLTETELIETLKTIKGHDDKFSIFFAAHSEFLEPEWDPKENTNIGKPYFLNTMIKKMMILYNLQLLDMTYETESEYNLMKPIQKKHTLHAHKI